MKKSKHNKQVKKKVRIFSGEIKVPAKKQEEGDSDYNKECDMKNQGRVT